jgi:predicted nucleotidyltransferase
VVDMLDLSERKRLALRRAAAALLALRDAGVRGWVIGSLAKGRFNRSSDVDIVVDCETAREHEAFRLVEKAMGDFPFHLVPFRRLRDDAKPFMMEGALDASGILSRQAEA